MRPCENKVSCTPSCMISQKYPKYWTIGFYSGCFKIHCTVSPTFNIWVSYLFVVDFSKNMHCGGASCSSSIKLWITFFQSYMSFHTSIWYRWITEYPSSIAFWIFSISLAWTLSGLSQFDTCVKCCSPSSSINTSPTIKSNGITWHVSEKIHQSNLTCVLHSGYIFCKNRAIFPSVLFLQKGHQYPVRTLYIFASNSEWHTSQSNVHRFSDPLKTLRGFTVFFALQQWICGWDANDFWKQAWHDSSSHKYLFEQ